MYKKGKHFVSQEWGLEVRGHEHFDFIDINLNNDNRLFIDPSRIEESRHPSAEECVKTMRSFFDELFRIYRTGSDAQKLTILSHAGEQNVTHLGYGYPGKGHTDYGLLEILKPLEKLIKKIPTIEVAQDLPVLIEGFAEDGMSDLLTNVLHLRLNEYTLAQMKKYGVSPNGKTSFYGWNTSTSTWEHYDAQPCYKYLGYPIMLVPKEFVRKKYLFSTSQYLRRIIIERMRNGGVGFDADNKPIPKTQFLKYHVPHDTASWMYDEVLSYTTSHPEALQEYHRKLPDFYSINGTAMKNEDIDAVIYRK